MSSNALNYQYNGLSSLQKIENQESLFLSKFNEDKKGSADCFFWGSLKDPFPLARCLITLSKTVQSSFSLSPFQLALLKDPIVTAGNEMIRFEGFSHCAGVYVRTDILEAGHQGEFPENGTTNVDFNIPLITALSRIQQKDDLVLSVGKKEVGFHKDGESIVERKVPLPTKWIKGLTTVQSFFADCEPDITLTRLQAMQLFRSIPRGKVKVDYFLTKRGNKYLFTAVPSRNAICIGGIHRLNLIAPLLPLINTMAIYRHPTHQCTNWVLQFDHLRFTFSLSRDAWRGFSGEGAALDNLIEDLPNDLLKAFDNYSYSNQQFNPLDIALAHDLDLTRIDQLAARLAAMGLLGYDLERNYFFYRRLPFKLNRILSLNPRLKGAEKLLAEQKVEIISKKDGVVRAKVKGSTYDHYVLIKPGMEKCTCLWYSQNQGERGPCKHILATKKLIKNQ